MISLIFCCLSLSLSLPLVVVSSPPSRCFDVFVPYAHPSQVRPPTANNNIPDEGLSAGAIAGIVIGCIAAGLLFGFLLVYFMMMLKQKRDLEYKKELKRQQTQNVIDQRDSDARSSANIRASDLF